MRKRVSLQLLSALPLVILAGAAGGCHSDAPIEARGEQYRRPWLMMGSEELRRDTMVEAPRTYRDEAGLLHVVVPVRNTRDQQLYVQYRFTFYDHAGAALNEINGTKTLPERGSAEFTGNSTSPRAADGDAGFKLELRYPVLR